MLSESSRAPTIDVLVPVYNESALVVGKLRNLQALAYPRDRITFWILDGGSTDGTARLVSEWIDAAPNFTLLRCDHPEKVGLINAGLARGRAEWVMVTDVDARVDPTTLVAMMAAAAADPAVGVIGTPVVPARAHPLERLHWRFCNRLQQLEHRCGSASIVTAPCYAFRRELVPQLPPDVVADDVHVALAAAAARRRVAIVGAQVTELRTPATLMELFVHKRRKARAYLQEIFRFLPAVGRMRPPTREIFLLRSLLLLGAPLALTALSAAAAYAAVRWPEAGSAVAAGALGWTASRPRRLSASLPALAAVLAGTLSVALVTYPFSRPNGRWPKIGPLDPHDGLFEESGA